MPGLSDLQPAGWRRLQSDPGLHRVGQLDIWLLAHLDKRQPVTELFRLAGDCSHEELLHFAGDGPGLAVAHDATIDLPNGSHLCSRTGQKYLIRGVQTPRARSV